MASLIEELIAMQAKRQAPQAIQSDPGSMLSYLSQGMSASQPNMDVTSVLNNQAAPVQLPQAQDMGYGHGSGIGRSIIGELLGEYFQERKDKKATESELRNNAIATEYISQIPEDATPIERSLYLLKAPTSDLRKLGSEGLADITKSQINPKDPKIFEAGAEGNPDFRQNYILGQNNTNIPIGPSWKPGSGVTVVTGDQGSQYRPFNARDEQSWGKPGPGKVGMIGPKGEPIFRDTGEQITPKPSQSQNAVIMGSDNTIKAAEGYKKVLDGISAWDSIRPNRRAEISSKYSNMILQAKEAYNLGVLNPNDRVILEEIVQNPVSFTGSLLDKETLKNQVNDLQGIMSSIKSNAQRGTTDESKMMSPQEAAKAELKRRGLIK